MAFFTLENAALRLLVSEQGGAVEGLWLKDNVLTPLLRPGKQNGVAVDSSCFPLVPFGNRVSGNRFSFAGKAYTLQPNVEWDQHYLHGDGWLNRWRCVAFERQRLTMEYSHREGVYVYTAEQTFRLEEDRLEITLSVTNDAKDTLPFGLGWHPYFPLTPETRVQANADGYWLEREHWLAGEYQRALPREYDFNHPSPLPRRWVNNAFAGWNGQATIRQPKLGYSLDLTSHPPAPCYFIFVSDPAFDKGYNFDFFCLEPMTHAPDDHHQPQGGMLAPLAQGQTLTQAMTLRISTLT